MHALPGTFAETRDALHRVAAHVLGRRRYEVSGRFGLRATPGGFGTPAFGPEPEVLRVAGGFLVRERGGLAERTALAASLAELAAFAGTSLDAEFSAGSDTPAVGDTGAALDVDPTAVLALGGWYAFGWRVVDEVLDLFPAAGPTVLQLWPEHFDAGLDVETSPGHRTNLGASPGDRHVGEPYLYVGPWDAERPGDPAYWNAPFGAVLRYADLAASADPLTAGVAFLRHGIGLAAQRTAPPPIP